MFTNHCVEVHTHALVSLLYAENTANNMTHSVILFIHTEN